MSNVIVNLSPEVNPTLTKGIDLKDRTWFSFDFRDQRCVGIKRTVICYNIEFSPILFYSSSGQINGWDKSDNLLLSNVRYDVTVTFGIEGGKDE